MISTFRVKANPLSWVVCRSEYGRLGLGPGTGDAKVPAPVPALADKTCVEVACGTAVSFAVTDSGSSPRDSAIVLPVKFAGLWIRIQFSFWIRISIRKIKEGKLS